jgi:hypothetical protein
LLADRIAVVTSASQPRFNLVGAVENLSSCPVKRRAATNTPELLECLEVEPESRRGFLRRQIGRVRPSRCRLRLVHLQQFDNTCGYPLGNRISDGVDKVAGSVLGAAHDAARFSEGG